MSAPEGIHIFGKRAVAVILKEYAKIYDMSGFSKVNPDRILTEEKKKALRMITLIKKKRCVKRKGCACADGITQNLCIKN